MQLIHLLFADDILLFSKVDITELKNLKSIISISKSLLSLVLMLTLHLLLRLKLYGAILKPSFTSCTLAWLLEVIQNPLHSGLPLLKKLRGSWLLGNSYISKCGRLTLIQGVLSNLPTYYLSTFQAPMSICKTIEKWMWNFLWEGLNKNGGSHLVNRISLLYLKTRSLGIDKVNVTSITLLSKWIWH